MTNPSRPLILHVIHHLVIGGMENGLVNLINSSLGNRYRHVVVCIEDYSEFRTRISRADVDVIALNRSQIGPWGVRQQIFRLCKNLKPDIVHTRNMSALDAIIPARVAGVRFIVHGEHGWDVDNLDGKATKPFLLRKLHSPFVSRYVTVSQHISEYMQSSMAIGPDRITQIYNGVDTDKFAPGPIRGNLEMPAGFDDRILVGTVGRLQAVKDQATLVTAFAMLLKKSPEMVGKLGLVVCGGGPLEAELRQQVYSLEIDSDCYFTGPTDNVADVLRALDIFVLPSLLEGISNTILEAMATSLPVLATNVGGNPELVESDCSGALFLPGDCCALEQLLRIYCTDHALRKRHGERSRRLAQQRYSLDSMASNYQAVYDGLVRPKLPAGRGSDQQQPE